MFQIKCIEGELSRTKSHSGQINNSINIRFLFSFITVFGAHGTNKFKKKRRQKGSEVTSGMVCVSISHSLYTL